MICGILALFSLLVVYSTAGSEALKYHGGNTEYFLFKQFAFIAGGLMLMYLCYNLDYMKYSKIAPILLGIAIPLLIYTIFYGTRLNGAARWITIPLIDQNFQTSDLAKLALIIYVARSLSRKQDFIKDLKSAFLPIIIPVVVICMLIMPANLSTAVLLMVTCLTMMFIGRVSMRYIAMLFVIGLMGFIGVAALGEYKPDLIRVDTWQSRIDDFLTGTEHQVEQSKIAIANGGLVGVGPGNSFQRNYLAYSYADFIYAIICEEYGLIGGLVILGLYLWLLIRCISLVTRCPKAFGAILAFGLCLNIVIQAFANIAVSVQLVPATGLTLPLISMGGTSILFTCISLGIILSVSRYVESAQLQSVALEDIEDRNEDHH